MIEVPLYRQTFGFSCGPAALMMVMGRIEPTFELDRSTETDIWRDATLFESRATSAYGLAFAALKRGRHARVAATDDSIGFDRTLKEHFTDINSELMDTLYSITVKEARRMGVQEIIGDRTDGGDKEPASGTGTGGCGEEECLEHIRIELSRGISPIVLVGTSLMGEALSIPHWVVVLGVNDHIHLANPESGRIERFPLKDFEQALGYDGYRAVVSVW